MRVSLLLLQVASLRLPVVAALCKHWRGALCHHCGSAAIRIAIRPTLWSGKELLRGADGVTAENEAGEQTHAGLTRVVREWHGKFCAALNRGEISMFTSESAASFRAPTWLTSFELLPSSCMLQLDLLVNGLQKTILSQDGGKRTLEGLRIDNPNAHDGWAVDGDEECGDCSLQDW